MVDLVAEPSRPVLPSPQPVRRNATARGSWPSYRLLVASGLCAFFARCRTLSPLDRATGTAFIQVIVSAVDTSLRVHPAANRFAPRAPECGEGRMPGPTAASPPACGAAGTPA